MKRYLLLLMCLCTYAFMMAQTVSGVVTGSDDGEPLIGVTVKVKGTQTAAVTDLDGRYTIAANNGTHLLFSYVGYAEREMVVRGATLDVQLQPDANGLDEVVVVGYGQAKRITLTGAVSAINGKELQKVPVSSVQNTLAGKLPGFFSQQRSGQPGKDASDFFIRGVSSLNGDGNKPLIIVDDVEYTYEQLSQININEIESISILKDASTTAIYGIKGANGVLVVKTRRGEDGRPRINVRVESGLQMPVREPNFLGSYQTAQLVNEAYANDGMQPLFTDADLEHFRTGDDPYGHPDVNWYDEIFKSTAQQSNANVDVSGGTERLKYFVSVGYFMQNGLVKDFGAANTDVNSNYLYRRFNYRSNIDFQVTNNLSMRLDVTSRFMNINEPYNLNATGQIYSWEEMHPYSAPVINPNGSWAYLYDTSARRPTLNARLANQGYRRTRRNDNSCSTAPTGRWTSSPRDSRATSAWPTPPSTRTGGRHGAASSPPTTSTPTDRVADTTTSTPTTSTPTAPTPSPQEPTPHVRTSTCRLSSTMHACSTKTMTSAACSSSTARARPTRMSDRRCPRSSWA